MLYLQVFDDTVVNYPSDIELTVSQIIIPHSFKEEVSKYEGTLSGTLLSTVRSGLNIHRGFALFVCCKRINHICFFTLPDWFTVEGRIKASSNVLVVTLNGGRITICVYLRISFFGIRDGDAVLRKKLNC